MSLSSQVFQVLFSLYLDFFSLSLEVNWSCGSFLFFFSTPSHTSESILCCDIKSAIPCVSPVYHVIYISCAVRGRRGFKLFYLPYFEKWYFMRHIFTTFIIFCCFKMNFYFVTWEKRYCHVVVFSCHCNDHY